jgi:hypothetical protein
MLDGALACDDCQLVRVAELAKIDAEKRRIAEEREAERLRLVAARLDLLPTLDDDANLRQFLCGSLGPATDSVEPAVPEARVTPVSTLRLAAVLATLGFEPRRVLLRFAFKGKDRHGHQKMTTSTDKVKAHCWLVGRMVLAIDGRSLGLRDNLGMGVPLSGGSAELFYKISPEHFVAQDLTPEQMNAVRSDVLGALSRQGQSS